MGYIKDQVPTAAHRVPTGFPPGLRLIFTKIYTTYFDMGCNMSRVPPKSTRFPRLINFWAFTSFTAHRSWKTSFSLVSSQNLKMFQRSWLNFHLCFQDLILNPNFVSSRLACYTLIFRQDCRKNFLETFVCLRKKTRSGFWSDKLGHKTKTFPITNNKEKKFNETL